MFNFYANNLLMIICMVYLLTIVILVTGKIYQGLTLIKKQKVTIDATQSPEAIKNIKLFASRILLYPIIMIFTHLGLVLTKSIYDFGGKISLGADTFAYISGGLLGTLNFIAFLLDPSVHLAFKTIYYRIVKKQEISKSDSDKSNYNDAFELNALENIEKEDFNFKAEGLGSIHYSKFIKSL
ncbi:hypothetical protein K502DRAFT_369188 [Neoconidiobolus thromboides FSU 785]|nr:hypothetical protein K502DRAFT_369188 [Neoconidiobolus thromboides FSU 785]